MSEPAIIIRCHGDGRPFRPGETLSGDYRLEGVTACQVKHVEVSVLWYTEGKGDEDMAVHEFWRHGPDDLGACRGHEFATVLPNSPLSYDGQIVKIRWAVRVRAFLHRGRDVRGERGFCLGDVPAAEMPAVLPASELSRDGDAGAGPASRTNGRALTAAARQPEALS
jgi:hypothetical protein